MENKDCYIQVSHVKSALAKMISFELSLKSLFREHELNLRENTGRRNMLLSQAQEAFFAKELSNSGYDITCSGKTGEPDIVLNCIGRELECKITSSKRSSWPLQCDYSTLKKKGSTDFLYVLSDDSFSQFAVLFFNSLTVDDFHPPAPGSRQKSRMRKSEAMKKCVVLHGSVRNKTNRYISKYEKMLDCEVQRSTQRINELSDRFLTSTTENKRFKIDAMINNETARHKSKKDSIDKKIQYWKNNNCHYEIELDCVRHVER